MVGLGDLSDQVLEGQVLQWFPIRSSNEETGGVLKVFLKNVIRDAVTYTEHAKRKTRCYGCGLLMWASF